MDDSAADWPAKVSKHLGKSIAAARQAKNISAVKLSELTAEIGMSVHRVAIPRIEKGEQVVTVPELIALGIALDADWSIWLIDAADSADVGGARSERIRLEAVLQSVEREIIAVTTRITFTTGLLSESALSDEIKELKREELQAHHEVMDSLLTQREALHHEIQRSRIGRAATNDAHD